MIHTLIKEYEYQSNDCIKVILKIFTTKGGYVLEQTKVYDFDGSKSVDSIYLPDWIVKCLK